MSLATAPTSHGTTQNSTSTSTTIQDDCQDALREFFKQLTPEESALFEATEKSEQLIKDLTEIDRKHKSSISRKAASNLQVFVNGIERYGQALDVVGGSVSLMGPIWGCSRIVLLVAKEYSEYFDKLSDMFEEIGYNLNSLRRYPRLYPDNQTLKEAMVDIFQAIVEFCFKARDTFRHGRKDGSGSNPFNSVGLRAAWKVIWKPFKAQFGDIIDRIQSAMSRIEREVDIAEKELASEERAQAKGERDLQMARWKTLESQQGQVKQYIDQQKIAQVNQWLSPVNAAFNHNSATKLRHQGTGIWFLDGDAFKTWLTTENSFLWLHAIPGAGKTILASTVIDWLRDNKESNRAGLAYFYCDYRDKQKQSPARIIGTILSMIASRNEDIFSRVLTFFEEQYKENAAYVPEFDELSGRFDHFVSDAFQELFIVIDALDESDDREDVACALKTIVETCKCVKILVTSRHEIDIARVYHGLPEVSIEPADVVGDIELYIKDEVGTRIKAKKLKLRDPNLEQVICQSLIHGANGMFQWVKCQIDQLSKLRNDRAIRNALDDLPKTLHETYVRILRKLQEECADDLDAVQRLLKWLVRGIRNLTLDELAECVSINPDAKEASFDFDAVFTDPEDVVELCGSLVTLSPDGYVALAHYSVKEFLISENVKETMPQFWVACDEVHAELASFCLTYICYDDFSEQEDQPGDELLQRFSAYKFLRYAVQAWGSHAHLASPSEDVFELSMRLFDSDDNDESRENYAVWCSIYQHLHKSAGQRSKLSGLSPLFFAGLFGLPRVVSELLDRDPDGDVVESIKACAGAGHEETMKVFLAKLSPPDPKALETCLYIAASRGHHQVVKLLLDAKVNVDARGGKHGTALQVAALEGRDQVVSTILLYKPDVNVTCKQYGAPIAAASEKSHLRTFQALLAHGANVNRRGGWYGFPLVSAIVGKNTKIIDALIARGADVNALGGRHGCPLMAAASMNMLDLIRSLVSHGARVNDENDKGSDSLYAACIAGHLKAVELLLDLGADVNAKGGKHRNALNAASSSGNADIVQCLLNAGADVEFFDEHYGNSVQVAASAGHETIVRLLVEAGVDVNSPAGDRGTALIAAASNGHVDIIRLLFDLGVPSGDTEEMTNALMVSARKGYTEVVQTLVDMGASIDSLSTFESYPLCTALEAAAVKSHVQTVNLLLSLGADVNFENEGEYGTALIAAILSEQEYTDVVNILLDAGADVNATVDASPDTQGCALAAAIFRQDYGLCTNLIDRGADVNLTNGCYYSCLQLAVRSGNDRLVDLLIDHGADINLTAEPPDDEEDDDDDENDDATITALQTAALHGTIDMVKKLIQLGAELEVDVEGCRFASALQAASFRDSAEIVKALIDAGSDVNLVGGSYGTNLQAAAYNNSLEAERALLEAGADINVTKVGSSGSALMAAASRGHETSVDLLIENGADVNLAVGPPYQYPLQAAAYQGYQEVVHILIQAGADVNRNGGYYGTALQAAASDGEEETCEILLKAGADLNIVGGRYGTALQAAYETGYYTIINKLYKHGASASLEGGQYGSALGAALHGACQALVSDLLRHRDVDITRPVRKYGSPLQACLSVGRPDHVLNILIDCGADVNTRGGVYGTPLIAAVVLGYEDDINTLLEAGADINLEGSRYYPSALYGAARNGNLDILKLVVNNGADLLHSSSVLGSPIEYATRFGGLPVIRYLLKHGVSLQATNKGRYGNVVQAAAINGNNQTIRFLVKQGADIHVKGGKYGSTLTAAVLGSDPDTVEFLLKKGLHVNTEGGLYGNPLQAAAARGSIPMTLLLLRYGADINAKGGKYGTALQAACVSGNYDLVTILLEHGADMNSRGGFYRTALHAAAFFQYDNICELLVKEGAEWSLVERTPSHFADYRLDAADEMLNTTRERQQEGWPENESDWESEEEESDEEQSFLELNVEAIPSFETPYTRPVPSNGIADNRVKANGGTLAKGSDKDKDRTTAGMQGSDSKLTGDRSIVSITEVAHQEDWEALDWMQLKYDSDGEPV